MAECCEGTRDWRREDVCFRGEDWPERVGVVEAEVDSGRRGRWEDVESGVSIVVASLKGFLTGVRNGLDFLGFFFGVRGILATVGCENSEGSVGEKTESW